MTNVKNSLLVITIVSFLPIIVLAQNSFNLDSGQSGINIMDLANQWLPQAADGFFDFLDNLSNAVNAIIFNELLNNLVGLGKAMLKIVAIIFSAVTPILQNWSQ